MQDQAAITSGLCEFCASLNYLRLFRDEAQRNGVPSTVDIGAESPTLYSFSDGCPLCGMLNQVSGSDGMNFKRIKLVGEENRLNVLIEMLDGQTVHRRLKVHLTLGTGKEYHSTSGI